MDDTTVTFILCGRLGDQARSLIPPPTSPAHLRTAFIIYTKLVRFFGVRDYQECSDVLDAMGLVRCKHGQAEVNDYISKWTAAFTLAVSQQSVGDVRKQISKMIRNLPVGHVFGSLVSTLPARTKTTHPDDTDAFFAACEEVLALEKSFRPTPSTLPSNATRSRPNTRPASSAPPSEPALANGPEGPTCIPAPVSNPVPTIT
ncbi:hypothetical protein CPC08DRAFT_771186 [Agrocybe pediades]|nr:hypothetical protein CPC08DRAFT_771186 [Agrocybe pediades]